MASCQQSTAWFMAASSLLKTLADFAMSMVLTLKPGICAISRFVNRRTKSKSPVNFWLGVAAEAWFCSFFMRLTITKAQIPVSRDQVTEKRADFPSRSTQKLKPIHAFFHFSNLWGRSSFEPQSAHPLTNRVTGCLLIVLRLAKSQSAETRKCGDLKKAEGRDVEGGQSQFENETFSVCDLVRKLIHDRPTRPIAHEELWDLAYFGPIVLRPAFLSFKPFSKLNEESCITGLERVHDCSSDTDFCHRACYFCSNQTIRSRVDPMRSRNHAFWQVPILFPPNVQIRNPRDTLGQHSQDVMRVASAQLDFPKLLFLVFMVVGDELLNLLFLYAAKLCQKLRVLFPNESFALAVSQYYRLPIWLRMLRRFHGLTFHAFIRSGEFQMNNSGLTLK